MKSYLAIIPARGGSKGIPHKNIVPVKGFPLIKYTIDVALEAQKEGLITRTIVSTDDVKIQHLSRSLGADAPFLRPADISGDTARSVDLVIHALNYCKDEGQEYDAVMLLQPTSPLRSLNDIASSVHIFETAQSDSLITCYEEEYISPLVSYLKDGDYAIPLSKNHNKGVRRQEESNVFIRNGAIYIASTDLIRRNQTLIADFPAMYLMEKERSVNLDTLADLSILEALL